MKEISTVEREFLDDMIDKGEETNQIYEEDIEDDMYTPGNESYNEKEDDEEEQEMNEQEEEEEEDDYNEQEYNKQNVKQKLAENYIIFSIDEQTAVIDQFYTFYFVNGNKKPKNLEGLDMITLIQKDNKVLAEMTVQASIYIIVMYHIDTEKIFTIKCHELAEFLPYVQNLNFKQNAEQLADNLRTLGTLNKEWSN